MIQPTLLFGASLSTLCAAIYFYVGRVLSRRRASSPDSRLAWRLFVVWWYALASSNVITAALSLLGGFGIIGLPLFTTFTLLNLLAICVALYGLVFYLLYLFTGSRKVLGPLSVFYIGYYTLLVYYVQASTPMEVTIKRWTASLSYQSPLTGPFFTLVLLMLLLPPILGGLAYFLLYFRVETMTQKYRVLLVSWSIVIWFLSVSIATFGGFSDSDIWQLLSRFIGLGAACAILFAYQPPSWIKRRFGVNSLTQENN
jgi:hypothetical protein